MRYGFGKAHRRADCAVVGAIALAAATSVFAAEINHYTDELRARASLPNHVTVTPSPIAVFNREYAKQTSCLAEVLYYEARGEGSEGAKAVAEVVFQRMRDGNYPKTICGVVYDGSQAELRKCQFSFACDESVHQPRDADAWDRVQRLAENILAGTEKLSGTTGKATAFHSIDVAPLWASAMIKTAEIGNHVFYRRDPNEQARLLENEQVSAVPYQLHLSVPDLTIEAHEEVEVEDRGEAQSLIPALGL